MKCFSSKTSRARFRSTAKAFTLIELLVVIAIIAILAAILFPVFARARENARRASCSSNQKQIGLGFMQYTQDYDETFPVAISGTEETNWALTLQPYLKSAQIFQCPSESNGPGLSYGYWGYNDYYVNRYICGWIYNGSTEKGIKLAAIGSSALVVLMADGAKIDANPACGDTGRPGYNCYDSLKTNIQSNDHPENRHLEGANYTFTDGHVKWFKPGKITGPTVATGFSFSPNTQ